MRSFSKIMILCTFISSFSVFAKTYKLNIAGQEVTLEVNEQKVEAKIADAVQTISSKAIELAKNFDKLSSKFSEAKARLECLMGSGIPDSIPVSTGTLLPFGIKIEGDIGPLVKKCDESVIPAACRYAQKSLDRMKAEAEKALKDLSEELAKSFS